MKYLITLKSSLNKSVVVGYADSKVKAEYLQKNLYAENLNLGCEVKVTPIRHLEIDTFDIIRRLANDRDLGISGEEGSHLYYQNHPDAWYEGADNIKLPDVEEVTIEDLLSR